MKLRTKEPNRQSTRQPDRADARAWLPPRRLERAGRPRPATPPAQLCDGRSRRIPRQPTTGSQPGRLEQLAPQFGLTLPAMNGKRHRPAPRWGRSTFGLVSVLALLAFACFPALSQADSSQGVYEEAQLSPTPPGTKIPTRTDPPAHVSQTGDNESGGVSSPGSQGGGSEKNPSEAGRESGTHDGKGQSSPPDGSTSQKPPSGQPIDSSGAGAGQESDSSSPLVPILIAIAVLAAISIGVVVFRQRRQGRGPDAQVSPEAS